MKPWGRIGLLAWVALQGACVQQPAAVAEPAEPARAALPAGVPPALAGEILADAVRRTGLAQQQWVWLEAEAVTWNDGSLGCAQPGRAYTQALVPGWRLVLRGGGVTLPYHAASRGGWVQCPAGRARVPAGPAVRM